MSVIGSNILAGASGQGGGYNLTRSLRFRASGSTYLNRSQLSGDRQKWTMSFWVKRGLLGSGTYMFYSTGGSASGNTYAQFYFYNDQLNYIDGTAGTGNNIYLTTTQVFRDPSAWYHIVISADTTQATASNRIKIYVNGNQVTSFTNSTYPSQNYNTRISDTTAPNASEISAGGGFDGYLAEWHNIDGQALTPSSFGATNAQTGVWQPKKYAGTYGTNGFYLPFTDNSALTSGSNAGLGKDFSGNGNYWNTNNISITSGSTYDSMTDVPTLTSATASNFCVLNPLANPNGTIVTYSNGNLAFSHSSSAGNANKMTVQGTMAIPAGKFYWEYTVGATVNDQLGIGTMLVAGGSADGTAGARYLNDGSFQSSYTTPSSASSYTTNDVLGMAYDQPSGTLAFYKNNTLQGTVTNISTSEVFFPLRSPNTSGSGGAGVFNFGQRPFAYTPPTGFVALNTFNLPTPTIGATASTQANKYFNAVLRNGYGSSGGTLDCGFQPDFVWEKTRSGASSHTLWDAVRGLPNALRSNETTAELSQNWLTAFASNGLTFGTNDYGTGTTLVEWVWKANGSGSTNTAGSITSTVSANTSAGFSVVTFSTNASSGGATIGHGLGVAPKMIIMKARNQTYSWDVYHASLGSSYRLILNSSGASQGPSSDYWNSTTPTSSVFSINQGFYGSGVNTVAYCFAEISGYSKIGSFVGNGSADGSFVYTGFRPKYIMTKSTSGPRFWFVTDTSRDPYNVCNLPLFPNDSQGETAGTTDFDILSNGFKARTTNAAVNGNGETIIYMAFAEHPFKYSLAR